MIFFNSTSSLRVRRFTALLGVALVLMLNVLAVRPDLHAALHASGDASSIVHGGKCTHHSAGDSAHAPATSPDHDCIVSAFAHGHADTGVDPLILPAIAFIPLTRVAPSLVFAAPAPEFLLPPGCGPPLV
ncbi:hypothetical protein [Horticoccus sp. 23ND18S-11]|uniref:hypothetical protein n=1 Tax=Horticoccus sp. 23ND18S-11 TaxID=3391832 RepID=UPI0039C9CBA7